MELQTLAIVSLSILLGAGQDGATGGGISSVSRVSISSTGAQGNAASISPSVSAEGNWIAFESYASNFVPDDTNGSRDLFLHGPGGTTRIVEDAGQASISGDGQTIAYVHGLDVFVLASGTTFPVGPGRQPSISADGRFVAYEGFASNPWPDVMVYDCLSRTAEVIAGNEWSSVPVLSADGRYVAFNSFASNLVPGDTNSCWDIFVSDMWTGSIERVSVSSSGAQAVSHSFNPAISGDGRFITFWSYAYNLMPLNTTPLHDVFLHDTVMGTTELVSHSPDGGSGNQESYSGSISADGKLVAFYSFASNLAPGDLNGFSDVFLYNRLTGRVTMQTQGNGWSNDPAVFSGGVVFESFASDLVPNDTNGTWDIFVTR